MTYCESIARNILPLYRAFVAKELIEKHGYTQVKAAKKLGTTQAAISQYVTSKRGQKGTNSNDKITSLIQAVAETTAERIATAQLSPQEFSASFCDLCEQLRYKLNSDTASMGRCETKISTDYQI